MGVDVVCRWPVLPAGSVPSGWVLPAGAVRAGRVRPDEIGRRGWIRGRSGAVRCGGGAVLRTCKNCKAQFDPALNHPTACRFHTAHFGGETKRKFESVYEGGTMNTPDSGKVFQYWHCCGSEDPFDPGCTAAPHCSYDD